MPRGAVKVGSKEDCLSARSVSRTTRNNATLFLLAVCVSACLCASVLPSARPLVQVLRLSERFPWQRSLAEVIAIVPEILQILTLGSN